MGSYWTCPYCGANLDPGERCDCTEERSEEDGTEKIQETERPDV